MHDLERFEGRRISRIRRAFFEYKGQVEIAAGLLELTFDDDEVVVFDGAGNGQSLRVEAGPWLDPFDRPLSSENEEWIAQHGKLTAFDVSGEEPFDRLIGADVLRVRPTSYVFWGVVSGVFIETSDLALVGENRFDDFYVTVIDLSPGSTPLNRWQANHLH